MVFTIKAVVSNIRSAGPNWPATRSDPARLINYESRKSTNTSSSRCFVKWYFIKYVDFGPLNQNEFDPPPRSRMSWGWVENFRDNRFSFQRRLILICHVSCESGYIESFFLHKQKKVLYLSKCISIVLNDLMHILRFSNFGHWWNYS